MTWVRYVEIDASHGWGVGGVWRPHEFLQNMFSQTYPSTYNKSSSWASASSPQVPEALQNTFSWALTYFPCTGMYDYSAEYCRIKLVDSDGNDSDYSIRFIFGRETDTSGIVNGGVHIFNDVTETRIYSLSTSLYASGLGSGPLFWRIMWNQVNGVNYLQIGCTWQMTPETYNNDCMICNINADWFINQANIGEKHIKVSKTPVSDEYGVASSPEGYSGGTFDDSSDTISIPTMPTIGVSSTGFVNVYNPSPTALTGFGSELFPSLSFTPISSLPAPTDVQTALENIATVLTDFGNQIPNIVDMYINDKLINYVLDCHVIPVAPTVTTNANIKVGFRTFSQSAPVVTSDYIDFDCGSLNIGEYYANFIDYSPYTQAKLFLPFVGYVDVLPEYWQSGTINVTYRFNIIDGSFIAYVKSTSSKSKLTDTIIGQYGGNCCVHIPVTGLNYSSMVSGLVSGAAAVVTQASGPNGGTNTVKNAVNIASARPSIQSSNGYNSTSAFLSCRTPYLMIERSVSSFSMNYATENGLPSNVSATLSTLSGYTEASNIIMSISGATEAESNEIAALLAGGVIL